MLVSTQEVSKNTTFIAAFVSYTNTGSSWGLSFGCVGMGLTKVVVGEWPGEARACFAGSAEKSGDLAGKALGLGSWEKLTGE